MQNEEFVKNMKSRTKPVYAVLIFALVLALCCPSGAFAQEPDSKPEQEAVSELSEEKGTAGTEPEASLKEAGGETGEALTDDHLQYTITLHAGKEGYFGDPSVKEKTSVQYKGDTFIDPTVPDTDNDNLAFLGWSVSEEAVTVDVISGMFTANGITDLYAVWTGESVVTYFSTDGFFNIDAQMYGQVEMTYPLGEYFRVLVPEHMSDQYVFGGWYTGVNGEGTHYTEESVIKDYNLTVYAKWVPNEANIPVMEPDKDYKLEDLYAGGTLFSFTPEETGVYEVFTKDAFTLYMHAYIRIMDENMNRLQDSLVTDSDGNAAVSLELSGGQKYYIQLFEYSGHSISLTARLHRTDELTVTFHASKTDDPKDSLGYFDDDPEKVVKEMKFKPGTDLYFLESSGLSLKDPAGSSLQGWADDKDAGLPNEHLIVDENLTDVYAVYFVNRSVTLDGNGGYFPIHGNEPSYVMHFAPGQVFETMGEPRCNDNSKKCCGWATTPDATEPDIFEGVTLFEDLPPVIYALYDERVLLTYEGNGGYFLDNPNVTVYEATLGKGHIFYGMNPKMADSDMECIGWTAPDGTDIMVTDYTADYIVNEDSVFKAIWGKYIVFDANGGCFFWDPDTTGLRILIRADGPFTGSLVYDIVGEPINFDPMKYLAGWATTKGAAEPDVIEGVTPTADLTRVYAVWKDDSYYFSEGESGTWTKGGAEGLRVVVKRTGDDRETYAQFTGIDVDGSQVMAADAFDAEEGSLIATFRPSYLESLEAGKHSLTVHFGEASVSTDFTIKEKEQEKPPVTPSPSDKGKDAAPSTADMNNLTQWSVLIVLSAAGIAAAGTVLYKKKR